MLGGSVRAAGRAGPDQRVAIAVLVVEEVGVDGGVEARIVELEAEIFAALVGAFGPGGADLGAADEDAVAHAVSGAWSVGGADRMPRLVVCTGGEPLLQLDRQLVDALHARGFMVAVETNGTQSVPPGIDWVCMSPKAGTDLLLRSGNELKLVVPQVGAEPESVYDLDFEHFFLQPMDGPNLQAHTEQAIRYCLEHPKWKVSLQTHKLLGLR